MRDEHLDLDQLLAGVRVEFPATPDLATVVGARLATPAKRRAIAWPVARAAALALAAVLLLAGLAVAGAFGVGPLRIIFGTALPTPNVGPLATRLALGEQVTLAELADRSGLPLLAPAGRGAPDEAYLLDSGIATLVWAVDPEHGLPALGGGDIGLLVMLVPGELEPSMLEKVVVEFEATLERVRVGDHAGWWISGAPHVLRYLDERDHDQGLRTRLVDTSLVWEQDGVVVRLESALGRDDSLALGSTLTPLQRP